MSSLGERIVLAIDPGTSKCGVACVQRTSQGAFTVLYKGIVAPDKIGQTVLDLREQFEFTLVAVGGGTASRPIVDILREAMPSVGILIVDEKDTTMDARARYWEHNPRKGWRRLLPATMQVPPAPVDDFVAIILAERILAT